MYSHRLSFCRCEVQPKGLLYLAADRSEDFPWLHSQYSLEAQIQLNRAYDSELLALGRRCKIAFTPQNTESVYSNPGCFNHKQW